MAEEKKTTLEEAATISLDEARSLTNEYVEYLAKGLKENQPRPVGPKWFIEYAKKRFIAGANWQKEQMLKDAVERTVKIDSGGYPYIDITAELYDYEHDVPLAKEGELVKIIIVKED